jgi:hypothetical protein
MTPRTKVWFFRLVLLAVATVVSLAFLEVVVRALYPYYNPQGPHQIVFHENEDGVPLGPEGKTIRQRSTQGDFDLQVSFNRFGFRDQQELTSATSTDWFVVGDSFGLGWGGPETNRFSNLLAGLAKIKVYNICVPTDIAGYIQLVDYAQKRTGVGISNLVVSVCMENDLRDYYRSNPSAEPVAKVPKKELVRSFLKSHSAVYLALATELQQTESLHRFFQAIGIARREDSEWQMHFNKYDEPAIRYSLNLMNHLASGRTRVVALIIPSRGLWIGKNRDAEAKVHDLFVSELRKTKNIEVVDMRPIFEATGNPMQFHFKHDGHWSGTGHQWAAKYLAEQILSSNQPPTSAN